MKTLKKLIHKLNDQINKTSILANFQRKRAKHLGKKLGQAAFFYKEDKVISHGYTFYYRGFEESYRIAFILHGI